MSLYDVGGLVGVGLILIAYAGAALDRLKATTAVACAMNLIGAVLILTSLSQAFNLSAVIMEGAWALVALFGLVRAVVRPKA
jgi:hypothetical protein